MMGQHQEQSSLFVYGISLENRVRRDHPLRAVRAHVDFSFARQVVAPYYGRNGHVGLDPEIILKLMFLLFFDNLPSERELLAQLPERLDYLWFLGYSLEDTIPDHSVLSKARRRWGSEVFEQLFVRTIEQCVAAGLVRGDKVHIDATLVDAHASRDSLRAGSPALIERLRALYRREQGKFDETDSPTDETDSPTDETTTGQQGQGAPPPGKVAYFSSTDPDAALTGQRGLQTRLRYKHHRLLDDYCGIITGILTTPGTSAEQESLSTLVRQHEGYTQETVRTVIGDAGYGTQDNLLWCQDEGIRCHLAAPARDSRSMAFRQGLYHDEAFVYDAATDSYRCPAGEVLTRQRYRKERSSWIYQAAPGRCATCPLRQHCTNSSQNRMVLRHEAHERIALARTQAHSAAAKRDRKRRRSLMEGSFADGVNNHGLDRARWRGLAKQRVQAALIAAAQNIRRMLRCLKANQPRTGLMALRAVAAEQNLPLPALSIVRIAAQSTQTRHALHVRRMPTDLRPKNHYRRIFVS